MRSIDHCPERVTLGEKLSEAITRMYGMRAELDAAKAANAHPEKLDRLNARLHAAREVELQAERDHREHVRAHGCSAIGS